MSDENRTVVFIHGFRFQDLLPPFLFKHDQSADRPRRHVVFEYDWRQSIDKLARTLNVWLDELYLTRGGTLTIVAHSLGGLVAVRALQDTLRPYVTHLATVATPHGGTYLAYLSVVESARDMRPGSPFMLTYSPCVPRSCRHLNVVTSNDWVVLPWDSCRLHFPHIKQLTVSGVGHLNLLTNLSIVRPIYEWFDDKIDTSAGWTVQLIGEKETVR